MQRGYTVLGLVLILAGCGGASEWRAAGPLAESAQSVRIDTPGMDGAACALQNSAGSYLVMSPAIVRVNRAAGSMTIACTKGEHFRGATTVAARRIEDVYSYPENICVPMGMNDNSLKKDVRVF